MSRVRVAPAWTRERGVYRCGVAHVRRAGVVWIAVRADGSRQVFSYLANAKKWAVQP